jgi:prepilin-type N-terminal cleavage/methylation domain-containing protein
MAIMAGTPPLFALAAMGARIRIHTTTTPCARRRRGFTLLEVTVVLVLLGIGFALAIPAFITPMRDPDDAVQTVVDAARRAAVRRAETVVLRIARNGEWSIEASRDGEELRAGRVTWPQALPLVVRISPLGACLVESDVAQPSITVDPLLCRVKAARS